jgi:hypothetical protein
MDLSEFGISFHEFSALGDGGEKDVSSVSSGSTSPPSSASTGMSPIHGSQEFMDQVVLATERWAHAQSEEKEEDYPLRTVNSDARSASLSTLTSTSRGTVVPVRIVRRSDAEVDRELATVATEKTVLDLEKEVDKSKGVENANAKGRGKDDSKRRRTWPSYKAICNTVSNIVHRKETPHPSAPPPTPAFTPTATPVVVPIALEPEHVKSSASLFSRRRRRITVPNDSDNSSTRKIPRRSFLQRALSSSSRRGPSPSNSTPTPVLQHRPQLRRSRSFSGFADILNAIVAAEREREPDEEMDMDEATAEARNMVKDIGRKWAFEEVMEDDRAGFLFERCIE